MRRTGVHFELTSDEQAQVWEAYEREDDAAVLEVLKAIEARWDETHLQETDKAWDAIDRCLGGAWPLSGAVLGGECVYFKDDCVVRFLDEHDVKEVASGLDGVNREWFAERFARLSGDRNYTGDADEADLQYTWNWFEKLRSFFKRASADERSVIFTAR